MLKAVVVERTGELPPRTHNLARLAELGSVDLSDSQVAIFKELSNFYIESRYAENTEAVASANNPDYAKKTLRTTEELVQWLFSMLK